MMDDNVPPQSTLLVVDALVKANKDFDLLLLPRARHGYGSGEVGMYVTRRRWDSFVEHMLGAEPPAGYEIAIDQPSPAPTTTFPIAIHSPNHTSHHTHGTTL